MELAPARGEGPGAGGSRAHGPGWHRQRTFLSQDGLSLCYRDYGDPLWPAPPVLCLAGLTRNSKDFHALASRLANRGRRVLSLDYRGRGRSDYDPDWRRYHPRSYLDDVRHLLIAANLDRVVVVGTSLGGALAMAMAVAMPTRLAGAVLNDVGPEVNAAGLAPIMRYLADRRPLPDWHAAADRLRSYFPDLPARSEEEWVGYAKMTFREEAGRIRPDWDPNIVKPLLSTWRTPPDLWPVFRALGRVPLVILRGETSRILTADTFRRMAEEMPLAMAVTVADVGHAPTLGEPEAKAAIDALLACT